MEDVAPARRPAIGRLAWAWLPMLAYAGLIFYLSSRQGGGLPRWWFLRYDKVLHAGEYFWFATLLARALRMSGWKLGSACIAAVAISFGFGISDEYHQSFVAGRQGNDWGDILADTVGAGLGAAAIALMAMKVRAWRLRSRQAREVT